MKYMQYLEDIRYAGLALQETEDEIEDLQKKLAVLYSEREVLKNRIEELLA